MTPNGAYAYVTNDLGDSVSVIRTGTNNAQHFSAVNWSIVISVMLTVLFLISLSWYWRNKKNTQQTQIT